MKTFEALLHELAQRTTPVRVELSADDSKLARQGFKIRGNLGRPEAYKGVPIIFDCLQTRVVFESDVAP